MRLLPVFLLFNGLAIILHISLHDQVADNQSLLDSVPNLLVIGYASLPARPMVPAWSLDIELQFYAIFPVIFAIMTKMERYAWSVALSALAVGTVYMAFVLRGDPHNVLPYIGFFLVGVLSAKNLWRPSGRLVAMLALLAVVLLAVVVSVPPLRGLSMFEVDETRFVWNTAMNVGLALLLTPLALASAYGRSSRRDRMLGEMSYVVYCSHWLAVILFHHYLSNSAPMTKASLLVALIASIYAVSFVVLIYFDMPIGRWRERWIGRFVRRTGSLKEAPALP